MRYQRLGRAVFARNARILEKFPANSLLAGNFCRADRLGQTASTATNLVSETTKELDLRRAGFARDFRPLSAVRFRDRRQRRFWAICGPSAPENLELLFQWCGSLQADGDCIVDGSRARSLIPLPSA